MSILLPVRVTTSAPTNNDYSRQAFNAIVEDVIGDVNSDKSKKVYSKILYKWKAWCEANNIHLLDMQREHVTKFLVQDKVGFKTRQRELYILKKAMRFAVSRNKELFGQAYERLETLKAPRDGSTNNERHSRAMSAADANKALSAWKAEKEKRGFIAIRALAINGLLAATGLRCAELAKLEVNHVNFERGTLKVWHGKRDKKREIAIFGEFALDFLKDWIEIIGKDRKYLFPTASKYKITGNDIDPPTEKSIYRAVKRIEKLAGMKIHTHRWRHTLATALAQTGMPLPNIKDQLGHASLDTTSIYAESVDAETIRARGNLGYGDNL